MKYLLLLFILLFTACTENLENTTRVRPIYLCFANMEETGQQVRILLDTLDTRYMGILVSSKLRSGLNLQKVWQACPENQRDWYPFYDIFFDWWCVGSWFWIENYRCGQSPFHETDFSRQERLTGEHIDIVIGGDGVRRMFDNDLSELPIDKTMVVPYDWGTSRE